MWFIAALFLALVGATGCSRSGTPSTVSPNSALRIDLEGLNYLAQSSRAVLLDSVCSGLGNLGDIDGDGYDDLLLSSHAPRAGQLPSRGWIEAYSGKNGQRLWQLTGRDRDAARAAGLEDGFQLENAFVIDDIDGDGVRDVLAEDRWTNKKLLLISGKTGDVIRMIPNAHGQWWLRPAAIQVQGAGQGALLFLVRFPLPGDPGPRMQVVNLQDGTIEQELPIALPRAADSGMVLLHGRIPDQNGDGVPDALARNGLPQSSTDANYEWELSILCGRQWTALRTVVTERPRITGDDWHEVVVGIPDAASTALVMSSSTGDGPARQTSSLRAISLADGGIIWKRLGTDFDGGRQSFLVDSAGKETDTGSDVEFGYPVVAVGDVDGDGTPDLASLIYQQREKGRVIAIFSGRDGALLKRLSLSPTRMVLDRKTPLVVLNRSGRTALATVGRQAKSDSLEIVIVEW